MHRSRDGKLLQRNADFRLCLHLVFVWLLDGDDYVACSNAMRQHRDPVRWLILQRDLMKPQ